MQCYDKALFNKVKEFYSDGDVVIAIKTPQIITPDDRYEMRNKPYIIDLNLDGNKHEIPIIYTKGVFGVRIPGKCAYAKKLIQPYIQIQDEDYLLSFDKPIFEDEKMNDNTSYNVYNEPDSDIESDNSSYCWDIDEVFDGIDNDEYEQITQLIPDDSDWEFGESTRYYLDYNYGKEVMTGYYSHYGFYSLDKKANKVFISPLPQLPDGRERSIIFPKFIIPKRCMGAKQEKDNTTGKLTEVYRVYHKKLERFGYWLDIKQNSCLLYLLEHSTSSICIYPPPSSDV
jgi:hypothetical protein